MNKLIKLLENRLIENGFEASDSRLLAAPEMTGEGKGKVFKKDDVILEYGKYPSQTGSNYYGYGSVQPWKIDQLRFGPSVGAYGQDIQNMNALIGLLATYPIKNGGARLMISNDVSNSKPAIFFGFDKRF